MVCTRDYKELVTVPAMTQMGAEVLLDEGKCIVSKNERKITIGHMVDNKLYMVNTEEYANHATAKASSLEQWHCRFGHLNYTYVNRLVQSKLVEGMSCSRG